MCGSGREPSSVKKRGRRGRRGARISRGWRGIQNQLSPPEVNAFVTLLSVAGDEAEGDCKRFEEKVGIKERREVRAKDRGSQGERTSIVPDHPNEVYEPPGGAPRRKD